MISDTTGKQIPAVIFGVIRYRGLEVLPIRSHGVNLICDEQVSEHSPVRTLHKVACLNRAPFNF
jgi:hypothetical protein